MATKDAFAANLLFGRKNAHFALMVLYTSSKPKNVRGFVESQIKRISERKKISKKEAARAMKEYIERMKAKCEENTEKIQRLVFNPEVLSIHGELASSLRHNYIFGTKVPCMQSLNSILKELEKYQNR